VKVLIIDDHPIVMAGCRMLAAESPDIELIGAADGEAGFELFEKHSPDVVVLDLNLPGTSSALLMRRMLQANSKARIVIFSMNDDPLLAAQMMDAGAKGFVSKSEDPAHIITAIREVAAFRYSMSPALAQKVATLRISPNEPVTPKLTPRERDILSLLASGKSMSEVANTIDLSYKTVSATCNRLRGRFDARTTVELVRIAMLLGIC
jgi:DNA-binding NarL/FixJ family response regulator